jgi:hypothetical protein
MLDVLLVSCDVPGHVLVMCCVMFICIVPWTSDTSIVILGFMTHSTFGRSFKAASEMYISCVRAKENLRFDFLNLIQLVPPI